MKNPYNTHEEILKSELSLIINDNAKILEFGTGEGSAPIFNNHAKLNSSHKIIAYESDIIFYNNTKAKYELSNYTFVNADAPTETDETVYDLIFIDQAPWKARIDSLNVFKDYAKTIIVHDYDFFNEGYHDCSVEENSWWYDTYGKEFKLKGFSKPSVNPWWPPTLVMKRLEDINS